MEFSKLKDASLAINEPRWVADLPNLPGVRLCVRSMASPRVMRALGKAMRAAPQVDGEISEEAQDMIDLRVIAETVLTDWEGFTDNGEPVLYTPELAREWLETDLFLVAVKVAASRIQDEAGAKLGELAKNLQSPSKQKPKAA